MFNINKKLILLFVVLILASSLIGCQSNIPEGFSKGFYNDIVSTSKSILKDIPNIRKEDVVNNTIIKFQSYSDFCDKYYNDYEKGNLTIAEEKAFKSLIGAVLNINTDLKLHYENGDAFPSKNTTEKIEELANLLEIEINYNFK